MAVIDIVSPALFSLLLWWSSTAAILWLDRMRPSSFPWSMLGATVALAIGLRGLAWSSADSTSSGAYCAFTCAVLAWGWQETAFLLGYMTGPRRTGCRPGCGGVEHFRHGVEAVLYHELALLAGAIAVVWLTWGGVNQVGTWTFLTLWALRLSAKLNLFLGVPNSGAELLPAHLRYLECFFSTRAMNLLFPFSITAATVLATRLWWQALAAPAGSGSATGATLLATLACLALLEHWLMVLPLRSSAPWSWPLGLGELASSTAAAAPSQDPPIRPLHADGNVPIGLQAVGAQAKAITA